MTRPEYDAYFAPIAAALDTFARTHNLLIQKYYHDTPVWSLCFTHPQGGQARLDIRRDDDTTLRIQTVWWQDDYDAHTRHIRWGEEVTIPRDETVVTTHLQRMLTELLRLPAGNWTQSCPDYEHLWGRMSKEEFEAMVPRWPVPKE